MKDGSIPNANIQASSENEGYEARNARLDGDRAWRAHGSATAPWIEADIGYLTFVSSIVTQRYKYNSNRVTKLKVSTKLSSDDVTGGIFIKDHEGNDMVCRSN